MPFSVLIAKEGSSCDCKNEDISNDKKSILKSWQNPPE